MKFIYYKDLVGMWRWRLVSRNGKIIADSGEGYSSKWKVKAAIFVLMEKVRTLEIKVEEKK
jgi:uncharacterized protein YegP (UPF0339 family)